MDYNLKSYDELNEEKKDYMREVKEKRTIQIKELKGIFDRTNPDAKNSDTKICITKDFFRDP